MGGHETRVTVSEAPNHTERAGAETAFEVASVRYGYGGGRPGGGFAPQRGTAAKGRLKVKLPQKLSQSMSGTPVAGTMCTTLTIQPPA